MRHVEWNQCEVRNFGILAGKVSALVRANFGHKLVIFLNLSLGEY
jgi:hypothetical protein